MKSKSETEFYLKLGNSIALARKKAGIKQETLASELGLSRFSIVNIEAGRQKASVYILVQISMLTNSKIEELLNTFDGESKVESEAYHKARKKMGKNTKAHPKLEEFYILSQKLMRNDL